MKKFVLFFVSLLFSLSLSAQASGGRVKRPVKQQRIVRESSKGKKSNKKETPSSKEIDYKSYNIGLVNKANEGDAKAQYSLGKCYEWGEGIDKNGSYAFAWYLKAANQGLDDAQYAMGNCYYFGIGVAKNADKAVMWYRKAAVQGSGMAQQTMGDMYYQWDVDGSSADRHGIPQNYGEAIYWYKKAAEGGVPLAKYFLGECYYYGRGVEQSYEEAFNWYKKYSEHSESGWGLYALGLCYYYGHGVVMDRIKAREYMEKAAVKDYMRASTFLNEHSF